MNYKCNNGRFAMTVIRMVGNVIHINVQSVSYWIRCSHHRSAKLWIKLSGRTNWTSLADYVMQHQKSLYAKFQDANCNAYVTFMAGHFRICVLFQLKYQKWFPSFRLSKQVLWIFTIFNHTQKSNSTKLNLNGAMPAELCVLYAVPWMHRLHFHALHSLHCF